jgi:chromosome partitioning protein
MGRERVIADHLATLTEMVTDADSRAQERDLYDTILLDCPPGQGLLVINALAAATHVLIPVSPEEMAVDGMRLFLTTLAEAKRARLNPRLAISGVLVTRVDDTRDARAQMDEIRATVEPPHIPIVGTIRERTIVKQAATAHRSILDYAPKSDVADAYRGVAATLVVSWGGVA